MAYYSGFTDSNHQIILKKINQLISTCTYVYTLYSTSHMPLTRYPKKKPEEQMRNCCHLGLCERQIPNKLRACSAAFDITASSAMVTALSQNQGSMKESLHVWNLVSNNQRQTKVYIFKRIMWLMYECMFNLYVVDIYSSVQIM